MFFVRDRQVFLNVLRNLGNRPNFVDISCDYNFDFADETRQ